MMLWSDGNVFYLFNVKVPNKRKVPYALHCHKHQSNIDTCRARPGICREGVDCWFAGLCVSNISTIRILTVMTSVTLNTASVPLIPYHSSYVVASTIPSFSVGSCSGI